MAAQPRAPRQCSGALIVVCVLLLGNVGATQSIFDLIVRNPPHDGGSAVAAPASGGVVDLAHWAATHHLDSGGHDRRNERDDLGSGGDSIISLTEFMRNRQYEHAASSSVQHGTQPEAAPTPRAVDHSRECYTRTDRSDYNGTVSVTAFGHTCRPWAFRYRKERGQVEVHASHNYCRGVLAPMRCAACYPSCDGAGPCYTTLECCDVGMPSRSCPAGPVAAPSLSVRAPATTPTRHSPPPPPSAAVDSSFSWRLLRRSFPSPPPPPQPVHSPPPPSYAPPPLSASRECYTSHDGSDYRGTANVTVNGYVCQRWTDLSPNNHSLRPGTALWYESGLGDHNYCRRPGGFACPWCYTLRYDPGGLEKRRDRRERKQKEHREKDRHHHTHLAWDCCDVTQYMQRSCSRARTRLAPETAPETVPSTVPSAARAVDEREGSMMQTALAAIMAGSVVLIAMGAAVLALVRRGAVEHAPPRQHAPSTRTPAPAAGPGIGHYDPALHDAHRPAATISSGVEWEWDDDRRSRGTVCGAGAVIML